MLLNEKNELHNRNLHISGLLNEEKVDIENKKVDIQDEKVNIENILSEKSSDFSIKTTVHIHRLFDRFGFDEVFGRSAVMELLEMKSSGASKLISNLVQADIIETVALLSKLSDAKDNIEVTVDMDEIDVTSAETKVTYQKVKE